MRFQEYTYQEYTDDFLDKDVQLYCPKSHTEGQCLFQSMQNYAVTASSGFD